MKNNKQTFASRANALKRKYKRAEYDAVEMQDLIRELDKLKLEQEEYKKTNNLGEYSPEAQAQQSMQQGVNPNMQNEAMPQGAMQENMMAYGGRYYDGGGKFNALKPYSPTAEDASMMEDVPLDYDYLTNEYNKYYGGNKTSFGSTPNSIFGLMNANLQNQSGIDNSTTGTTMNNFAPVANNTMAGNLVNNITKKPIIANNNENLPYDDFENKAWMQGLIGVGAGIMGNLPGLINPIKKENYQNRGNYSAEEIDLYREREIAKQQAEATRNIVGSNLKNVVGGNYLSNLTGAYTNIDSTLGDILGKSYQNEETYNAQARERARGLNNRSLDDVRRMNLDIDIMNKANFAAGTQGMAATLADYGKMGNYGSMVTDQLNSYITPDGYIVRPDKNTGKINSYFVGNKKQ